MPAERSIIADVSRGELIEASKTAVLISDEAIEQRVARAKAAVAPATVPFMPASVSSVVFRSSVPARLPTARAYLSSSYGMRVHPIDGSFRMHQGVDFAGAIGTPIYATGDGRVGAAKWNGNYGLFVQVSHGSKLETRYAHMSRIAVAPGQVVRRGDVLGFIGSTGSSTGPHLHYEVWRNGRAVNPLPYLAQGTTSVRFAELSWARR